MLYQLDYLTKPNINIFISKTEAVFWTEAQSLVSFICLQLYRKPNFSLNHDFKEYCKI